MALFERLLLPATISLYTLAFGAYLAARVWRGPRLIQAAAITMGAGFACHTAAIALRWSAVGHPPVFGTFENALAGAWFVVLCSLAVGRRSGWLTNVGLITAPAALAIMAWGLGFDQSRFPLTISERSLWVDIHAVFAWLSYSSLTIAAAIAVFILLKSRRPAGILTSGLPAVETMDDWLLKYVIYGFVTQTFTIATGAYFAFLVFGRWWRWDPVESLTLVFWLLYALFIHLKRSFGWSGARLAWLAIIPMTAVIAAYWLLVYWPPGATFHIFDIRTRVHVR